MKSRPSLRRAVAVAVAAVIGLVAAALGGCAASFAEQYARLHPEFDPARFPHANADLEETLATLTTPKRDAADRTTLSDVRIFAVGGNPWFELPADAVERGEHHASGVRDWLVVARVSCLMTDAYYHRTNESPNWYLLRNDRLVAYRRASYDRQCRGKALRRRYAPVNGEFLQCLDGFAAATPGAILDAESGGCGALPDARERR